MSSRFWEHEPWKNEEWLDDTEKPAAGRPRVAPGKRTLTMSLLRPPDEAPRLPPVQYKADAATPRQRKERLAISGQWLDAALRPDVHDGPDTQNLPVQRKHTAEARGATPAPRGGGRSMPEVVQAKMEDAFATDFSEVRVHEDTSAETLGALAYTRGTDIHFAPGQYQPQSRSGQELLGHELAHVVQQSRGRVEATTQAKGVAVNADAALEREADEMGAKAARGEQIGQAPGQLRAGAGGAVQRKVRLPDGTVLSDPAEEKARALLEEHDEPSIRERLIAAIRDNETHELENVVAEASTSGGDLSAMDEEGASTEGGNAGKLKDILGALLSSGEYVFNNPPLNSSGDIYHTIGFLAILREHEIPLPTVVIGYNEGELENEGTHMQANRALEFAAALGFAGHVKKIAVTPKKVKGKVIGHANVKLSQTRKAIGNAQEPGETVPVLDQKTSTGLISVIMQVLGKETVTEIIGRQLTTYRNDISEEAKGESAAWIEAQMKQIRAVTGGDKKLLLFNERIAINQLQHNSEGEEFTGIREAVGARDDIAHYCLRSHGEAAQPGEASSPAFAGAGADGKKWPGGFNTKVQHLQLLRTIKEEYGERLLGIYGSTSGTLDAAALIGIKTLSLHQFPIDMEERTTEKLNEQDQREVLMAPFKSVLRRQGKAHAVEVFNAWLAGTYQGPTVNESELGKLHPVFTKVINVKKQKRSSKETTSFVPQELADALQSLLQEGMNLEAAVDAEDDATVSESENEEHPTKRPRRE